MGEGREGDGVVGGGGRGWWGRKGWWGVGRKEWTGGVGREDGDFLKRRELLKGIAKKCSCGRGLGGIATSHRAGGQGT